MSAIVNLANGVGHQPTTADTPLQLSIPLRSSLNTKVHLQIANSANSLLVFIATREASGSSTAQLPASMGSFVYAMPDQSHSSGTASLSSRPTLTTALYTRTSTLDFTTRMARVIARKANKPVFVSCDVDFAGLGRGGDVEEEMEAFRSCVALISNVMD